MLELQTNSISKLDSKAIEAISVKNNDLNGHTHARDGIEHANKVDRGDASVFRGSQARSEVQPPQDKPFSPIKAMHIDDDGSNYADSEVKVDTLDFRDSVKSKPTDTLRYPIAQGISLNKKGMTTVSEKTVTYRAEAAARLFNVQANDSSQENPKIDKRSVKFFKFKTSSKTPPVIPEIIEINDVNEIKSEDIKDVESKDTLKIESDSIENVKKYLKSLEKANNTRCYRSLPFKSVIDSLWLVWLWIVFGSLVYVSQTFWLFFSIFFVLSAVAILVAFLVKGKITRRSSKLIVKYYSRSRFVILACALLLAIAFVFLSIMCFAKQGQDYVQEELALWTSFGIWYLVKGLIFIGMTIWYVMTYKRFEQQYTEKLISLASVSPLINIPNASQP